MENRGRSRKIGGLRRGADVRKALEQTFGEEVSTVGTQIAKVGNPLRGKTAIPTAGDEIDKGGGCKIADPVKGLLDLPLKPTQIWGEESLAHLGAPPTESRDLRESYLKERDCKWRSGQNQRTSSIRGLQQMAWKAKGKAEIVSKEGMARQEGAAKDVDLVVDLGSRVGECSEGVEGKGDAHWITVRRKNDGKARTNSFDGAYKLADEFQLYILIELVGGSVSSVVTIQA
ncbi:hypothetical protein Dimus_031219 [Dionaea muscipula]